ncbi:MucBP domain-containing protein [Levilactobacillus brevis]|uniref:MucBP domain-containing protein n=1 Tax=Levilactobacillus brevis TaxID=1580 RepID=UPI003D16F78E
MHNQMVCKEHYKMYKKGKIWVFAGIITASIFLGVVDPGTAHADTTADTTSVSATADVSSTPAKQVTITSSDEAATTETKSNQTVTSNDEASTNENASINNSNTQDTTTPSDSNTPQHDQAASDQAKTTDKTAAVSKETTVTGQGNTAEKGDSPVVTMTAKPTAAPQSAVEPTTQVKPMVTSLRSSRAAVTPIVASAAIMPTAKAAESTIDQWMPNKTLQQWILEALNNSSWSTKPADVVISDVSQITQADMLYLKTLDIGVNKTTYIDGETSFSLEGLQYATNLTYLNLMPSLNMKPYTFYGDITDISPLSTLTKLTFLQLAQNRISDITPIAKLDKITYLSVVYNHIADFSSLNAAQYTQALNIGAQFITQDLVYIPKTGTYAMVNPVKAPQGWTMTMTTPKGAIGKVLMTSPNGTVQIFWNGGTGSMSNDAQTINYQMERDQIEPGQTYNPWATVYPNLVVLPYTYYMDSQFSFKDSQGNATGDAPVNLMTPYIRAEAAANITVKYVDGQGNQLADPKTLTGFMNEPYTVTAATIPGWALDKTEGATSGTFSADAQTITFIYKEAVSTVTVHYQDDQGQTIKADTAVPGQVGQPFDIAHPTIAGYTYQRTIGDAQGTYTETPAEVTFVYTKDAVTPPIVTPTQKVTVTVHYRTADGTTVAPDQIITGNKGDRYETTPITKNGYQLVTTPANATGTYGDQNIEVTYIYAATDGTGDTGQPEQPDKGKPGKKPGQQPGKKPGTTESPVTGGAPAGINQGVKTQSTVITAPSRYSAAQLATKSVSNQHSTTLPQTNEKATTPWWGVLLLALTGGTFVGHKWKRKN